MNARANIGIYMMLAAMWTLIILLAIPVTRFWLRDFLRRWLMVERDLVVTQQGREADTQQLLEAVDLHTKVVDQFSSRALSRIGAIERDIETLDNTTQATRKKLNFICAHADSLQTTVKRFNRSISPIAVLPVGDGANKG